jgi:hypothetical protein
MLANALVRWGARNVAAACRRSLEKKTQRELARQDEVSRSLERYYRSVGFYDFALWEQERRYRRSRGLKVDWMIR